MSLVYHETNSSTQVVTMGQRRSGRRIGPSIKSVVVSALLASLALTVITARSAYALQAGEEQFANSPGEDRQNRGQAATLKLDEEPSVVWKYNAADANFAAVASYDGVTVALDQSGTVHGLQTKTGRPIWRVEGFEFSFGYGLELTCDPDLDVVLVGGEHGVTSLDRRTGRRHWQARCGIGAAGPAYTGDFVVAPGYDGHAYGLDPVTGEVKWRHDFVSDRPEDPPGLNGERARISRPARPRDASTDGKTVFFSVFDQCRTIAVDAESGERRWAFESGGWMGSRPTVGEFNVFVASQDNHFYAIDKDMGVQAWKFETGMRTEAPAAVGERVILFGSCDGKVYCVDRFMGNLVWSYVTELEGRKGAPIYSQPILAGETVIMPAMYGKVYGIDLDSGELKWKMEPVAESQISGQPQVDEGMLILTTRKDDDAGESAVVAIGYPE